MSLLRPYQTLRLQELALFAGRTAYDQIPRESLTAADLSAGARYLVPHILGGYAPARYAGPVRGTGNCRAHRFDLEGSRDSVVIGETAVPHAVHPVTPARRYQVVDKPRKPKPNKGPQPRGHHWSK